MEVPHPLVKLPHPLVHTDTELPSDSTLQCTLELHNCAARSIQRKQARYSAELPQRRISLTFEADDFIDGNLNYVSVKRVAAGAAGTHADQRQGLPRAIFQQITCVRAEHFFGHFFICGAEF
jgi:hypothetical protein